MVKETEETDKSDSATKARCTSCCTCRKTQQQQLHQQPQQRGSSNDVPAVDRHSTVLCALSFLAHADVAVMADREALYDVCHSNVDTERMLFLWLRRWFQRRIQTRLQQEELLLSTMPITRLSTLPFSRRLSPTSVTLVTAWTAHLTGNRSFKTTCGVAAGGSMAVSLAPGSGAWTTCEKLTCGIPFPA